MNREEIAKENFNSGMNCAQAVVAAFSDLLGKDAETLVNAALSFGGGLGRQGELCGTVSGMSMVAGALYGEGASKGAHYAFIRELCDRFREETGSIVCRELLGQVSKNAFGQELDVKKRPCVELCALAAKILSEAIEEKRA